MSPNAPCAAGSNGRSSRTLHDGARARPSSIDYLAVERRCRAKPAFSIRVMEIGVHACSPRLWRRRSEYMDPVLADHHHRPRFQCPTMSLKHFGHQGMGCQSTTGHRVTITRWSEAALAVACGLEKPCFVRLRSKFQRTGTSDHNRVMTRRAVIPFTAMSGPQPSSTAVADPRTVQLALELLERTAGRRPRCRRCRRVIAAKARPGLVGVHTMRSGHRGRHPPGRDRSGAPAAISGLPDRHRAPASGRPDLRQRLQKRALAPVAQPAPPGTLIRGGP